MKKITCVVHQGHEKCTQNFRRGNCREDSFLEDQSHQYLACASVAMSMEHVRSCK
jgi:hypothetical protein